MWWSDLERLVQICHRVIIGNKGSDMAVRLADSSQIRQVMILEDSGSDLVVSP